MKYDVFISYSSKDQKVAEGICGFLESNGYRCFVAYRDIPRGVVWAGAIADAIDESQMMVVVFSKDFNISPQTDREIELAAENNIPILTYRITDDKFTGAKKFYLKNLNWIDAFPNPEDYFGNLIDNINKLIGGNCIVNTKHSSFKTNRNDNIAIRQDHFSEANQPVDSVKENDVYTKNYIDLGLPSGTLWATKNIGADNPEDYGYYFAWGETKPKSIYSWNTYKWYMTKFLLLKMKKYGTVDNISELDLQDDAAYVNWGCEWCMPSLEQIKELKDKCKWEWTTYKGKNGCIVTGPNGNTLFLPAAGYRSGTSMKNVGETGVYWQRSRHSTFSSNAYLLSFRSDRIEWDGDFRFYGQSVRPVRLNT